MRTSSRSSARYGVLRPALIAYQAEAEHARIEVSSRIEVRREDLEPQKVMGTTKGCHRTIVVEASTVASADDRQSETAPTARTRKSAWVSRWR